MNIQEHLLTSGDVLSYLKSLNPNVPAKFEQLLSGRGMFYTLTVPDHELTIFITVANSLFVKGGIFLSIEMIFYEMYMIFQMHLLLPRANVT